MRQKLRPLSLLLALCLPAAVRAAPEAAPAPDWRQVDQQAATLLSEYLRVRTENPPGRTVEAAAFLARLLSEAGIATETVAAVPEKPFVIGRLRGRGGTGKPIVLLNHMDVVPADPARWSFPPFSGEVRDGHVHGRGAVDMKGFAIAQLLALRLFAEGGERPQRDVVFLAVPDEEVGGAHGAAWLDQHRPDLLDAFAVWNEGGGGILDAFPVPTLLISVAEKQVLWLRLIAEGPAGHGSRPSPNGAPRRLQAALSRVFDNLPAPRLTPLAREVFRSVGQATGGFEGFAMRRLSNPVVWLFSDGFLQQDPLLAAMTRDTVALTMLEAGYKPNVIPERAAAVLDCRLLPDTKADAFIGELQRTIDDPAVRIEIIQPPELAAASPTDQPLYLAMRRAAAAAYPGVVITPSLSIGGTDSRFFRRRGVPAYGFSPVLLPKEIVDTAHGVDERLPVSVLGRAVRIVYDVLRQM